MQMAPIQVKRCSASLGRCHSKPEKHSHWERCNFLKMENNKCWRGRGEIGTLVPWGGVKNGAAVVESGLTASQKVTHTELPHDPAIPLQGIRPEELKTD